MPDLFQAEARGIALTYLRLSRNLFWVAGRISFCDAYCSRFCGGARLWADLLANVIKYNTDLFDCVIVVFESDGYSAVSLYSQSHSICQFIVARIYRVVCCASSID